MTDKNVSTHRPLDLDAVQAFVLVADFASFTRAAEALDTTQSAVSLKLKRLEQRLGRRLLLRTPRQVRLSPEGAGFLVAARELLVAHERALRSQAEPTASLRLGISDQAAGSSLPLLLAKLNAYDRGLLLETRVGSTRALLADYDKQELDAVIGCRDADRRDGETLFTEPFGWYASVDWQPFGDEPLRLAALAAPCLVRAAALRAIEEAGLPWREVFVGGGVAAVAAAVTAGLAVAAMTRRSAPPLAIEIGPRLGLPLLDPVEVALYSRATEPRTREAVRIVATALRANAQA